MFDLDILVRNNIRSLTPYSSARSEFGGGGHIHLDANENSLVTAHNRYPDPLQMRLKQRISELNGVPVENIFVGHGSDEAIDLLMRIFCEPAQDETIICPPTYGMFEVLAAINDVKVIKVPLADGFALDPERVFECVTDRTKLVFLCSPNNPTGNALSADDIRRIASEYSGIVVVDEAYIHFAQVSSLVNDLPQFPNLIILQTLSKAWGLAGARIGFAFGSTRVVDLLAAVKAPYNISGPTQEIALAVLERPDELKANVAMIVAERQKLARGLAALAIVQIVYPSDANFCSCASIVPGTSTDTCLITGSSFAIGAASMGVRAASGSPSGHPSRTHA